MSHRSPFFEAVSITILTASLFVACGSMDTRPSNAAAATAAQVALPALNRPIPLHSDSTRIVLSDHLPVGSVADSVRSERGGLLPIVNDSLFGPCVWLTEQPELAMGFVQIWTADRHLEIPTLKSRTLSTRFSHEGNAGDVVHVMGDFNGWSRTATPMTETAPGAFSAEVTLPIGKHPYQFVVNAAEIPDAANPERVPNGFGGWNSLLTVGEPDAQPLPLSAQWGMSDNNLPEVRLNGVPGTQVWAYWNDELYGSQALNAEGKLVFNIPAVAFEKERSDLRFWAASATQYSQVVRLPLIFGQLITHPDQLSRQEPSKMIMYFLMVDRFINGDSLNDSAVDDPGIRPAANHHGGDLQGVLKAVEQGYFDSLGVNTVWVSPIVQNPEDAWGYWQDPNTDITSKFSGYHGYWPIRSTAIDHRFGTMQALQNLTNALHARNSNLLLDYVANHVHEAHPVYRQHPDWATDLYLPDGRMNTQLWDEQRLTTWFDSFMPSLDFSRPEVVETMTDSAAWWIENTGIDGFRHDATKHIPALFWRRLTAKVRTVAADDNRQIFQIGETYGSPDLINSYINHGMLDAQFDFNLYDAAVDAFGRGDSNFDHLVDVARKSSATYGADHFMGNITGNQDRARFASLAEGTVAFDEDHKFAGWTRQIGHKGQLGYARMQQLQTFILAMPGIPCLYYGDEIADVGGNDPDNRRMFRWTNLNPFEEQTREHFSAYAHLRLNRMSMIAGTTTLEASVPGLLAIQRDYPGERTIVYINKSDATLPLPLARGMKHLAGDGELAETGPNGEVSLILPPLSTAAVGN